MKQQKQNLTLQKRTNTTTTTTRSSRRITPSNHHTSDFDDVSNKLLIRQSSTSSIPSFHNHVVRAVADRNLKHCTRPASSNKLSYIIRSFLKLFTFPIIIPSWLTISSHLSITSSMPRKVTGTLFGNRHGHISFAVQLEPRSEPILLLQLAMTTFSLVKEMSSGLVRITLECEKSPAAVNSGGRERTLFHEPTWTMYCNGKKCGYAVSRTCGDLDWHVLRTVQSVSVGAGVIPLLEENGGGGGESEGELTYMRARFERVIGSRNSESFYMLNPDGNGGPELSIFLLRI